MGKTALINFGGAVSVHFSCGALSYLVEQNKQFDLVIASSSGTITSLVYLTNQINNDGLKIWSDIINSNCISLKNLFKGKYLINFDKLIDILKNKIDLNLLKNRNFFITLTCADTGNPYYLRANKWDIWDMIRASCSLPCISRGLFKFYGSNWGDGGFSGMEIKKAIDLGATDITVIFNEPLIYKKNRPLISYLNRIWYLFYPNLARAWATKHLRFNENLELINNPPPNVKITVISPEKRLPSKYLVNQTNILAGIEEGYRRASEILTGNFSSSH